MAQPQQNSRLARLIEQINLDPGLAERMSGQEGDMVRAALNGQSVYEIAQDYRVSEQAVWDRLAQAARAASGRGVEQVETGGLGSDTDPGVSGGYGDTGFGSLGNEPDVPITDELQQRDEEAQRPTRRDDPRRPSQAEGEPEPGKDPGIAPPRPSQAEGELEDVEENLRRKERGK